MLSRVFSVFNPLIDLCRDYPEKGGGTKYHSTQINVSLSSSRNSVCATGGTKVFPNITSCDIKKFTTFLLSLQIAPKSKKDWYKLLLTEYGQDLMAKFSKESNSRESSQDIDFTEVDTQGRACKNIIFKKFTLRSALRHCIKASDILGTINNQMEVIMIQIIRGCLCEMLGIRAYIPHVSVEGIFWTLNAWFPKSEDIGRLFENILILKEVSG
ncbi:hypothetical protein RF11_11551 [Thelohanellus kitauei]|uniref:Uncharacterized protein n=1 Tax=Thelohanellus kitauei TaxID=669202 RepID=A0A0C2J537_THEKT|nr:hypothetical protein RF11_11551 [Thelohanellus kitauei]